MNCVLANIGTLIPIDRSNKFPVRRECKAAHTLFKLGDHCKGRYVPHFYDRVGFRKGVRVARFRRVSNGRQSSTIRRKLRKSKHASFVRSEEHTSELQSLAYLVCRLLLEKKKNTV